MSATSERRQAIKDRTEYELRALTRMFTESADMTNMATYLAEVAIARQMLRDAGFGCTGTPIIDQVQEALEAAEAGKSAMSHIE